MSLLNWEATRALSPRARFVLHEMVLQGGEGPYGFWSNLRNFAGGCFGRALSDSLGEALLELKAQGVLFSEEGSAWFPALALERLRALRASAQDVKAWRASVDRCPDADFRARVLLEFDAALRETPGCKTLVKAWACPADGQPRSASAGLVSDVLRLYEQILPGLPKALKITAQRAGLVEQRLRDLADPSYGGHATPENKIEAMRRYFERVAASDFLMGRTDSGFRADFEWLMRPTNFLKVMEGRYDNKDQAPVYSPAFIAFMQQYPNPVDLARSWRVWQELALDTRLEDVLVCVQDDRMRYGAKRQMPPAWKYLQDQPWLLSA